jgi:hypothetical protein
MVGKKNCPSYFLHCVYIAPDEQTIKTHAERGEFPANSIAEIKTMIDPTTELNS